MPDEESPMPAQFVPPSIKVGRHAGLGGLTMQMDTGTKFETHAEPDPPEVV